MVKQDLRVTEEAQKLIKDFFECLSYNNYPLLLRIIALEPSLIYARNDYGNTVFHVLIVRNTDIELETLKAVFVAANEAEVQPDLTLTNNLGADVIRALAVIEGTPLYNEFGEALQPYMADYYAASGAALRAQNEAYFAREEVVEGKKAIKKMEDGGGKKGGDGKCTIMSVQIDNDEAYSNIFGSKHINSLFTMDDQKELNRFAQFNAEPLPINFDFTPKGFALSSESSNMFSIMVIPSIFEGVTIEQIQHYVEKISDYLFNPAID